jgi:hypothetical protein
MNIKISQLTPTESIQDADIIPIVRNNTNYTISAISVFNYANGDLAESAYTTYNLNSASYSNVFDIVNNVYTSYNQNSGNYLTINGNQVINNDLTISNDLIVSNNLNVERDIQAGNVRSNNLVYDQTGNSNNWNSAYTFANNNGDLRGLIGDTNTNIQTLSSKTVFSDISNYSTATQITNMIAITQAEFATITPDPTTFYIVI